MTVHLPDSINVCVRLLIADIFRGHKNPFAYNKIGLFLKLLLSSRQPDQACVHSTGTVFSTLWLPASGSKGWMPGI